MTNNCQHPLVGPTDRDRRCKSCGGVAPRVSVVFTLEMGPEVPIPKPKKEWAPPPCTPKRRGYNR